MARRATTTSAFGVSKRESHDARPFYDRFVAPEISSEAAVHPDKALDRLICADARSMREVPDASVALVVTSPPYFAGKAYEEALGRDGVPATYLEYLALLRDVFAECVRTLEPGGRIAVNVANLGRRPYRSLSADVTRILQDDLRLLLRGEIVWVKQRGSSGSCAWGSFQRPANPVLRDLTERVIVASKGRFDRAVAVDERRARGLPHEASLTREDFMEDTLDVWEIGPESATRVGHPAPFPVELPARLIDLHTYRGDLVLDPFLGSGTTAVAAVRTGRHFVGYDLDPAYVELAEERVATAHRDALSASPLPSTEGAAARDVAKRLLAQAGFSDVRDNVRLPGGVVVSLAATGRAGERWLFEVGGGHTTYRGGLTRSDVMWKAIGKAAVLREVTDDPLVLLTTELPSDKGAREALARVTGDGRPLRAVVAMLNADATEVLRTLTR